MSRSLNTEEERGTYRGHAHPHNGYYAGDFSTAVSSPTVPATIVGTPSSLADASVPR